MICAVEWKRLLSAVKSSKSGYPPIFHFSEKFVWLTCLGIFFTSGTKVGCEENSVLLSFFNSPRSYMINVLKI